MTDLIYKKLHILNKSFSRKPVTKTLTLQLHDLEYSQMFNLFYIWLGQSGVSIGSNTFSVQTKTIESLSKLSPNKIESRLLHHVTRIPYNGCKLTEPILITDFYVTFNNLSKDLINQIINYIMNNPSERKTYSWIAPLQDIIIQRELLPQKGKKLKKSVSNEFTDSDWTTKPPTAKPSWSVQLEKSLKKPIPKAISYKKTPVIPVPNTPVNDFTISTNTTTGFLYNLSEQYISAVIDYVNKEPLITGTAEVNPTIKSEPGINFDDMFNDVVDEPQL